MASDAENYQRTFGGDPIRGSRRSVSARGTECVAGSHVVATPQRTQNSTSSSYSFIGAPLRIKLRTLM